MIEWILRHWHAATAPPMPDSVWGSEYKDSNDAARAAYLAVVAWWRYEYAEAMLVERRRRKSGDNGDPDAKQVYVDKHRATSTTRMVLVLREFYCNSCKRRVLLERPAGLLGAKGTCSNCGTQHPWPGNEA